MSSRIAPRTSNFCLSSMKLPRLKPSLRTYCLLAQHQGLANDSPVSKSIQAVFRNSMERMRTSRTGVEADRSCTWYSSIVPNIWPRTSFQSGSRTRLGHPVDPARSLSRCWCCGKQSQTSQTIPQQTIQLEVPEEEEASLGRQSRNSLLLTPSLSFRSGNCTKWFEDRLCKLHNIIVFHVISPAPVSARVTGENCLIPWTWILVKPAC